MVSTSSHSFSPNQRVTWHPDGLAALSRPAVVERVGPKRLLLRIGQPTAVTRQAPGLCQVQSKWVSREHVQPRALPSAFFSERMACYVKGFHLQADKHPVGATPAFPEGIWYSQIDDMEVGGPCTSAEAAVASAYACLLGQTYKTQLSSIIEHTEREAVKDQPEDDDKRARAVADAKERLEKVRALIDAYAAPREVLLERGNPLRGPESGTGHGRWVRVRFLGLLEENGGMQSSCQLLEDDPWAAGAPDKAGDVGLWSTSAVVRWAV